MAIIGELHRTTRAATTPALLYRTRQAEAADHGQGKTPREAQIESHTQMAVGG